MTDIQSQGVPDCYGICRNHACGMISVSTRQLLPKLDMKWEGLEEFILYSGVDNGHTVMVTSQEL